MIKKIITLLFVVTLIGCESLDTINENPNASERPSPAYLLTGIEKQGADLYWGINSSFASTLLFIQHWAEIQYAQEDRYEFSNSHASMTTLWNTGYATLITDATTIINLPSEEANVNYRAIALILRSWVYLLLTDAYGDIPYREVGQSLTPVYDTQRDVYVGLLSELSEASSQLSGAGGAVSGDVVYGGDIEKWRKFANSLRLRIALRIADREESLASSTIASLSESSLIAGNAESFQFIYTSSPQHNPQSAAFDTRDDQRISATLVNRLKLLNDPRLPVYAQLPSDPSVTDYVGALNGLSEADASAQGLARTSKPGIYFLTPSAPATIYAYSEVLFNLSEAVARGFIQGDAASYYHAAITASFNQFGIDDAAVIESYLSQPLVVYDATNYRRSIGDQKWIALYGQGLDAFAEWRRLDYPELVAGPASVLNGSIPLRFFYPGTEQSLNGINRAAAVSHQGEDALTTRLWFDVVR